MVSGFYLRGHGYSFCIYLIFKDWK